MMKNELEALTRHEVTLEEFKRVEAIYMADERMTKEEAAKVWKALYGDAAKKRDALVKGDPTADEFCDCIDFSRRYTHDGYAAKFTIRGRLYEFETDGRAYFWQGREIVRVDIAKGTREYGPVVYNLLKDDRRMHVTPAA